MLIMHIRVGSRLDRHTFLMEEENSSLHTLTIVVIKLSTSPSITVNFMTEYQNLGLPNLCI